MSERFPELNTKRFHLRQINQTDLPDIFKALSHPEVIKYYGIRFSSLVETQEQMDWFEKIYSEKTGIWWAICSAGNHTFLGSAGLYDISTNHKKCEIGFWLLRDHWGQGIISEVIPVICNYAFNTLGLHRIQAFVEYGNAASGKVLLKSGFKFEGLMKDCEIKDGKFISLEIYSMLKGDE